VIPMSEAAFWAKYALASAVVGPLIFKPPLWPEYRKEQVVGLSIGLLSWTVTAAALWAVVL